MDLSEQDLKKIKSMADGAHMDIGKRDKSGFEKLQINL